MQKKSVNIKQQRIINELNLHTTLPLSFYIELSLLTHYLHSLIYTDNIQWVKYENNNNKNNCKMVLKT